MRKEKAKTKIRVGEKIFYYDGDTNFSIEEVIEVDKKQKLAVLSNNARIVRFENSEGCFKILSPHRDKALAKRSSDELEAIREAIMAKRRIHNYLFRLDRDLLQRTNPADWKAWTEKQRDSLIKLANALEEILC